jgi:hypothetical protein
LPVRENRHWFVADQAIPIQKYMKTINLAQFRRLRDQLSQERETIETRLRQINEALGGMPLPSLSPIEGATGQTEGGMRGRRGGNRMSAAGRARIAAAQRARWAKMKGGEPSNGTAQKPKRKMSAAARKAIAAAARKRWAAAKAAGKTRL